NDLVESLALLGCQAGRELEAPALLAKSPLVPSTAVALDFHDQSTPQGGFLHHLTGSVALRALLKAAFSRAPRANLDAALHGLDRGNVVLVVQEVDAAGEAAQDVFPRSERGIQELFRRELVSLSKKATSLLVVLGR